MKSLPKLTEADIRDRATESNAYHHAVRWLQKARIAYLATGREDEWQQYLADLLDRHRRKSKLLSLLEDLLMSCQIPLNPPLEKGET